MDFLRVRETGIRRIQWLSLSLGGAEKRKSPSNSYKRAKYCYDLDVLGQTRMNVNRWTQAVNVNKDGVEALIQAAWGPSPDNTENRGPARTPSGRITP